MVGIWRAAGPPLGPSLRARLGSPKLIRRFPSSSRSRVWLVEFDGTPAIVKQAVSGPAAASRFTREVTALRLAGRMRPRVVPALLAADRAARVLVMEYLTGQGAADEWMISYATALARLHAAAALTQSGTSALAQSGIAALAQSGIAARSIAARWPADTDAWPADTDVWPAGTDAWPAGTDAWPAGTDGLPDWTGPSRADAREFLRLAARLRVAIPRSLPDELHGLLGRLHQTGLQALLHGDPCPDNAVPTSDGIRFVDLEQAALGNNYAELAYLRIGFPPAGAPSPCPSPSAVRPRPPTTRPGTPSPAQAPPGYSPTGQASPPAQPPRQPPQPPQPPRPGRPIGSPTPAPAG